MIVQNRKKAVVLLSGGLDSATCLAIARDEGHDCHALSFDYGQRSASELDAAAAVAEQLGAGRHVRMGIDAGGLGGSALTDETVAVPDREAEGIPATYVPARNTVFLANALAWAEALDADAIFIGVNALDYSGYPDCRPAFIDAFRRLVSVATRKTVEGGVIEVRAPLIDKTKAEIIRIGLRLGVDYSLTVSCYQAGPDGSACGRCDSCRLRMRGFAEAGAPDPARRRNPG